MRVRRAVNARGHFPNIGSAEGRLPGHHEPGLDQQGPQTLVLPLERSPGRLRHDLRRTPVRRAKVTETQPLTPLNSTASTDPITDHPLDDKSRGGWVGRDFSASPGSRTVVAVLFSNLEACQAEWVAIDGSRTRYRVADCCFWAAQEFGGGMEGHVVGGFGGGQLVSEPYPPIGEVVGLGFVADCVGFDTD